MAIRPLDTPAQPVRPFVGGALLALLGALLFVGATGCGNTTITTSSSSTQSGTQGVGGGGGSGGMGQGGSGGSFNPGQGGNLGCMPSMDNAATLLIDGQPAVNAHTQSVLIAPGFSVGLCFEHMPPDMPTCPHTLSIGAEPMLGTPVPAWANANVFGEAMESAPDGFTLTLTSEGEEAGDPWTGTFEGTITGATQSYVLSGTFQGCTLFTE